jgi:hypothetical protein
VYRLPTSAETERIIRRMNAAHISERLVYVSYFKELREPYITRGGKPAERTRYFAENSWVLHVFGRRPMLTHTHSIVEPVTEAQWDRQGHPYIDVIRWPKKGEADPLARRLRLDRVSVGVRGRIHLRVSHEPFLVRGSDMDPT